MRAAVGVVDAEGREHRLSAKIAQGKGLLAPELAAQGGLPVGHRQGFGSAGARQAWFGRQLGPGSERGLAQWCSRHGKASDSGGCRIVAVAAPLLQQGRHGAFDLAEGDALLFQPHGLIAQPAPAQVVIDPSLGLVQARQVALCQLRLGYPRSPVTLLGRLAIGTTLKGQRMGRFLLMDALWRSLGAAAQIAAVAVVVDAKDKAAEAFYAHFGFTLLQQRLARMFLPPKVSNWSWPNAPKRSLEKP
jgi:hypothetical protein